MAITLNFLRWKLNFFTTNCEAEYVFENVYVSESKFKCVVGSLGSKSQG